MRTVVLLVAWPLASLALMEGLAWPGSRALLPDEEVPLPEYDLAELMSRTSRSAVLFSGGGSRAFAAAMGQLAALRDLEGVLGSIRYAGGVSGGAWATGAFSFRSPDVASEAAFLGPVVAPEDLSAAGLGTVADGCALGFPSRFPAALARGLAALEWNESVADGWVDCAWDIFLRPAGVPRHAVPTWSAATEAAAKGRGGAALAATRFARVADPGARPFPLLALSLWGPVASLPQAPAFHLRPRVVAASPLYVGSPAATVVAYDGGLSQDFGGLVEPHVWGCAARPSPRGGGLLVASDDAPRVHGCGLTVEDAIGISSWFAGATLATFDRFTTALNDHLGAERVVYSPASRNATLMVLSDGGTAENLHLSGALQRGCDRVIMFMNFEQPLSAAYDPSLKPGAGDVQDDLPAFFGIDVTYASPLAEREAARAWALGQNKFFDSADFAPLVRALQNSSVATMDHVTVENAAYGVRAGHRVTITWVYLNATQAWADRLPPDVADLLATDESLAGFPHYATNDVALSVLQASLLHALVSFVVLQNKDHFLDLAAT